jgi:glycosyltransferase involved in cell wall biosynthesis
LRPSKNILQLLRAYRFLLKECYFGRKLILTGNPQNYSAIGAFVQAHGLENDVLFLPSLSDPQLAAFYRLADLAVNPSLSEGGMPFTFSEAVSVGTPIVMSDIAVTREVLIDEELRELTLFDPYDWRSIASTIERALADRQMLYDLQRSFFDKHLAPRTWDDVVVEHLAIMDELGKRGPKAKNTE